MNQGRRYKGEIRYQEVQGTRSYHKKPTFHGNWQPNIPSWEKRFCYSVGSVPWSKVIDAQKSMYLYENIVKWNDSACEEAFHNAKGRFWANINCLPCDLALPDPDMYIDKIDWDSQIDPELYLDLEREPHPLDENDKKQEEVVIFDNFMLMNESFSGTGWGDDIQKPETMGFDPKNGDFDPKDNPWESNNSPSNGVLTDQQVGDSWKSTNGWKNNCNEWRQSGDWNMSRYKTSRFNGEHYPMDRGLWRSGRGRKRANFVY